MTLQVTHEGVFSIDGKERIMKARLVGRNGGMNSVLHRHQMEVKGNSFGKIERGS
jgi:hypothetical protein